MSSNYRPVAAKPTKVIFDPFNSSATGHQRAENRLSGSTSWRESRNLKLNQQYTSSKGGGQRQSDTVGAGSEDFGLDGRLENGGWEKGAKGLRDAGQQSIFESMKLQRDERPTKKLKLDDDAQTKPNTVVNPYTPFRKEDGSIRETSWTSHEARQECEIQPTTFSIDRDIDDGTQQEARDEQKSNGQPQIFAGLTIYINGSTAPLISDHKLKYLLSTHGARTSISLGRKTVTHVIVGRPGSSGGSGGGLSGSKLHKEVTRHGGKNVRFVTAEWIVESVKAGKRLSESKYQCLDLGGKGVGSVANVFGATKDRAKSRFSSDYG